MKDKQKPKLSLEEIDNKILEQQEVLKKLRFAHNLAPIENPMRIGYTKKNIARLLTSKNEMLKSTEKENILNTPDTFLELKKDIMIDNASLTLSTPKQ